MVWTRTEKRTGLHWKEDDRDETTRKDKTMKTKEDVVEEDMRVAGVRREDAVVRDGDKGSAMETPR